ncbi:hypothetical protein J6590_015493 [Homalodisca vitripennis]|nr:hypothetical protein J6590_015493 [Homalodisca vitripennis]
MRLYDKTNVTVTWQRRGRSVEVVNPQWITKFKHRARGRKLKISVEDKFHYKRERERECERPKKKFPNPVEKLPIMNQTLFGKQVTRIERKEGEVEVTCADGSTYLADHVIVSVSLRVLKKHAADVFHPVLPPEKTAAIEVRTLLTLKVLEKEVREKRKMGSWTPYMYGFNPVMNHERMLYAWLVGDSCRKMESLTDVQVADGLLELLNKIVGNTYAITKREAILKSNWCSNPYTLGSYSFRTVESDRRNITNEDLAPPVLTNNKPVLLFAGEASHPHYFSTVHSAIKADRREAYNIINYIPNNTN